MAKLSASVHNRSVRNGAYDVGDRSQQLQHLTMAQQPAHFEIREKWTICAQYVTDPWRFVVSVLGLGFVAYDLGFLKDLVLKGLVFAVLPFS